MGTRGLQFCDKQRSDLLIFRRCPLFLRRELPSNGRALPPSLMFFLCPINVITKSNLLKLMPWKPVYLKKSLKTKNRESNFQWKYER